MIGINYKKIYLVNKLIHIKRNFHYKNYYYSKNSNYNNYLFTIGD